MELSDLKCIDNNIDIDLYQKYYKYVRDNMDHPEWLGTFTNDEIKDILASGGKIWIYYDNDNFVGSVFYIPNVSQSTLDKHNIDVDAKYTASLGPVIVSPKYVGNGMQYKMQQVYNEYIKSLGFKYSFTKAHSDNIYSIKNILKDDYKVTHEYINDRGPNKTFIKTL